MELRHITSVRKLANRIKCELNIDVDQSKFMRVYAGCWQRNKGAWSWSMPIKNSHDHIGSQFRVSDLLKCEKLYVTLAFGDYHIDPSNDVFENRKKASMSKMSKMSKMDNVR